MPITFKKPPARITRAINEAYELTFRAAKTACPELDTLHIAKDDPDVAVEALEFLQSRATEALNTQDERAKRLLVIDATIKALKTEGWTQEQILSGVYEFATKNEIPTPEGIWEALLSREDTPAPLPTPPPAPAVAKSDDDDGEPF